MNSRAQRIENALWGLFAGDALAMPAHWFYSLKNLEEQFDGGLKGYEAAPHPHPESFMVGMDYKPDVEHALKIGRKYDILHEHTRFYDTSWSDLDIRTGERESEHGNATPAADERYHYHHGLKAGENTVAAHLVRVLMRSVVEQDGYDEESFLESFVDFMTTPGSHPDPYLEIYLRSWFEHYSYGLPLQLCAERQRRVWSIGSMGGLLRPMVVSLLSPTSYQGLGFALEHQNLTHRSENVASALGITIPMLHRFVAGEEPMKALLRESRALREPTITGKEMFGMYREHKGPGNIPDEKMWRLHVEMRDEPYDLAALLESSDDEDVVLNRYATACYPEQGLPLALFLMGNHGFDPEAALLANANAGGDNVHRGGMLGLLVGAAVDEFPQHLKDGLLASDELEKEITAFAEVAAG